MNEDLLKALQKTLDDNRALTEEREGVEDLRGKMSFCRDCVNVCRFGSVQECCMKDSARTSSCACAKNFIGKEGSPNVREI
jgi:hypothetical protein